MTGYPEVPLPHGRGYHWSGERVHANYDTTLDAVLEAAFSAARCPASIVEIQGLTAPTF